MTGMKRMPWATEAGTCREKFGRQDFSFLEQYSLGVLTEIWKSGMEKKGQARDRESERWERGNMRIRVEWECSLTSFPIKHWVWKILVWPRTWLKWLKCGLRLLSSWLLLSLQQDLSHCVLQCFIAASLQKSIDLNHGPSFRAFVFLICKSSLEQQIFKTHLKSVFQDATSPWLVCSWQTQRSSLFYQSLIQLLSPLQESSEKDRYSWGPFWPYEEKLLGRVCSVYAHHSYNGMPAMLPEATWHLQQYVYSLVYETGKQPRLCDLLIPSTSSLSTHHPLPPENAFYGTFYGKIYGNYHPNP